MLHGCFLHFSHSSDIPSLNNAYIFSISHQRWLLRDQSSVLLPIAPPLCWPRCAVSLTVCLFAACSFVAQRVFPRHHCEPQGLAVASETDDKYRVSERLKSFDSEHKITDTVAGTVSGLVTASKGALSSLDNEYQISAKIRCGLFNFIFTRPLSHTPAYAFLSCTFCSNCDRWCFLDSPILSSALARHSPCRSSTASNLDEKYKISENASAASTAVLENSTVQVLSACFRSSELMLGFKSETRLVCAFLLVFVPLPRSLAWPLSAAGARRSCSRCRTLRPKPKSAQRKCRAAAAAASKSARRSRACERTRGTTRR